jgi:hypothetical protein
LRVFVEPTISAASNGLTLETELDGVFDVADKTASGSGSYSLMSSSTVLESGTFMVTRLVAFQLYGCGEVEGAALPPRLESAEGLLFPLGPRLTSMAKPRVLASLAAARSPGRGCAVLARGMP